MVVGPIEPVEAAASRVGGRCSPVEPGEQAAPAIRRTRVGRVDGEHVHAGAERDERRRLNAGGRADVGRAVGEILSVCARRVAQAVERHLRRVQPVSIQLDRDATVRKVGEAELRVSDLIVFRGPGGVRVEFSRVREARTISFAGDVRKQRQPRVVHHGRIARCLVRESALDANRRRQRHA